MCPRHVPVEAHRQKKTWSNHTIKYRHHCPLGRSQWRRASLQNEHHPAHSLVPHLRCLTWICQQQSYCTAETSGNETSSSTVLRKFHKYKKFLTIKRSLKGERSYLWKPPAQEWEGRAEVEGPCVALAPKRGRVCISGVVKVIFSKRDLVSRAGVWELGELGLSWLSSLQRFYPSRSSAQISAGSLSLPCQGFHSPCSAEIICLLQSQFGTVL